MAGIESLTPATSTLLHLASPIPPHHPSLLPTHHPSPCIRTFACHSPACCHEWARAGKSNYFHYVRPLPSCFMYVTEIKKDVPISSPSPTGRHPLSHPCSCADLFVDSDIVECSSRWQVVMPRLLILTHIKWYRGAPLAVVNNVEAERAQHGCCRLTDIMGNHNLFDEEILHVVHRKELLRFLVSDL